jgi:hypothetical protein
MGPTPKSVTGDTGATLLPELAPPERRQSATAGQVAHPDP